MPVAEPEMVAPPAVGTWEAVLVGPAAATRAAVASEVATQAEGPGALVLAAAVQVALAAVALEPAAEGRGAEIPGSANHAIVPAAWCDRDGLVIGLLSVQAA